MANPSGKLSSNQLMKNKIHTLLMQKNNKNGNPVLLTNRGFFKTAKVGFYIFGFYAVFAALLNLLIAYMALTSSLSDDYRLFYHSFILPYVLILFLCVASLIFMLFKKDLTACFISAAAAIPLTIHFIQIFKAYTASYKTQLITINLIIFLFQICAFLILIFKFTDKKLEDKYILKALNTIYQNNHSEDSVINEEQLIKAIENYTPHL